LAPACLPTDLTFEKNKLKDEGFETDAENFLKEDILYPSIQLVKSIDCGFHISLSNAFWR